MYSMDNKAFAGKIKSISAATGKMRELVQEALIAATYLCIKNSGGATPFQQILDAVGTSAHRQGITQYAETFAPVLLRDGKFKLNATAYKGMGKDDILADFDAHVAESGMDVVKWYEIAKEKNSTESIFDADKSLESLFKRLEKNALPGLAQALRLAAEDYSRKATAEIRSLITER